MNSAKVIVVTIYECLSKEDDAWTQTRHDEHLEGACCFDGVLPLQPEQR